MTRPLLLSGGAVLDVVTATWQRRELLLADGLVAELPSGTEVADTVDVTGLLLTPGLVDAQVNGAAGVDLTRQPERLGEVARALLRSGVTAFAPTVITGPPGTVERAAAQVLAHRESASAPSPASGTGTEPAARVLLLHAEGPFLAPGRRGAHPAQWLRAPDPALVADWHPGAGVGCVTLAPELPGALELIELLTGRGVQVWLGHSAATYEQVHAAVRAGARAVTHLFNAMPPLHHREPGLIGAALGGFGALGAELTAGVIVDGHHVAPAAVRLAWRALCPAPERQRFMLVSDTTAALGLPAGRTVLGDHEVILDGEVVRLADDPGVLAGSGVGLDHCVRTLARLLDHDFADSGSAAAHAFVAATRVPADLLGRPDLGRLQPGALADVAIWDGDLRLHGLVVGGELLPAGPP